MHELLNRRTFLHRTSVAAASLAFAGGGTSSADAASRKPGRHLPPAGLVAFRIGSEQWSSDAGFDGLLAFFRQAPGTADELAFFTSGTHPPLPLAEVERRAERLSALLPRVRAEGMGAGINLLATMGHHEENLDGSLDEPWQRVVDPHGRECRGSYCSAGDAFRDYVARVYSVLTQAGPDFLWIDDDVRLAGHMPIGLTCFCDGCLRRFSNQAGREFDRTTLLASFGSGSLEERLNWRRRWLEHNRSLLDELFRLIETTVHGLRGDLPLGFMTGDRFYEGYDFTRWARTLAGPGKVEVRWRPGGGFYSDESLAGLASKAHDVGRQVAQLPPEVTLIQSEIENFPYDLLRKSVETTVVEAAAHLAAGTTGTAFNVLSQRPDPLEEYAPMLRRIREVKPFYQQLRDTLGRTPLRGMWPAWNRDLFAANQADGAWPEGATDAVGALMRSYVLGELGIPLCYASEGATASILAGPGLLSFAPEELRRLFSGGVLMDVAAWQALDRLGWSGWTGVRPGAAVLRDGIEELSDHPLNGRFRGWSRDCRQSFWREAAYPLEPVSGARVARLASLTDYAGRDLGSSMTAFTNDLGGRVVVMGYYPWSQMHHLAKSSQMKAVCAWLSDERLPVVLETFSRVHVWVRQPTPDRLTCVLLNASLDPAHRPTLRLAGNYRKVTWHGMDGRRRTLKVTTVPRGSGSRVEPPTLGPWSVGLAVATA